MAILAFAEMDFFRNEAAYSRHDIRCNMASGVNRKSIDFCNQIQLGINRMALFGKFLQPVDNISPNTTLIVLAAQLRRWRNWARCPQSNWRIKRHIDLLERDCQNISRQACFLIESIRILKDGYATALYGSRGANGVIVITTRQGAAGAEV